ncbi:peptidase domain-containing ABC transporter [Lysinibacillus sp. M3]|uniref:Peptidase domain-containing ABC transporter n=1 Tax=Lysinibacillus zambalensis TaxID=3160866 RepID=A0ABV1MRQ8_9BACI
MRKKTPVILQRNKYDCGYACLAMLFSYDDSKISSNMLLTEEKFRAGRDGVTLLELKRISKKFNAELSVYKVDNIKEFIQQRKVIEPMMIHWKNNHFIIITKIHNNKAEIIDPEMGISEISYEELMLNYSGFVATLKKNSRNKEVFIKEKHYTKKLFELVVEFKKYIYIVIFLSFLYQSLNLLFPFMTQFLIDTYTNNKLFNISIKAFLISIVTIFIIYFMLHLLRIFFITKTQLVINSTMTSKFIDKLFKLPLSFYDRSSAGDIASRINNITMIREIISSLTTTLLLDITLVVIYSIVLVKYSVTLSVVVFTAVLIQIILVKILLPKISIFTNQEVAGQAAFQTDLFEVLRSINYIKTIGVNTEIKKKLNDTFQNQLRNFAKRMNLSAVLGGLSSSINLILPVALLFLGLQYENEIGLSLGQIVAFSTMSMNLLSPISSIIGSLESIKLVEEVYLRIDSVLEEEEEKANLNPKVHIDTIKKDIVLEDISFGYSGKNILHNINLCIKPGEKYLIKGTTGVGKTTLFKIIAGLYEPTIGIIKYGVHPYDDLKIMDLRKNIGFITQEVSLFNGTIEDNIRFYNNNVSSSDIVHAAKMACIHEEIIKFPMGYNTVLGDNGATISGGQRQRLSIARTLAANPEMLLIDEGTSNLDIDTEEAVIKNLFATNKTILFISHRHKNIEGVNHIYKLDNGLLQKEKEYSLQ